MFHPQTSEQAFTGRVSGLVNERKAFKLIEQLLNGWWTEAAWHKFQDKEKEEGEDGEEHAAYTVTSPS